MSLKKMINHSFTEHTVEDWKRKAEESLKGKGIESLETTTYEGILLKPLYTKEDLKDKTISQYPGSGDLRRGSSVLGYIQEPWEIAQRIDTHPIEEFKKRLKASFQKGQTAIAFTPSLTILKELPRLLADDIPRYSFSVNGASYQKEIIHVLTQMKNSKDVTGYIGKDPVSLLAKEQGGKEDLNTVYDHLYKTVQAASTSCPKLKTLLVDTTFYHNGGANAVQELAIALATGVHHIEQLKKRGLELEDIFGKMVFSFSIGSHFFMEVAKLRAARGLWSKVIEAYGVPVEKQGKMTISADTSWFTKTAYDPYVNILRASNEAFAAVLGGVQYLHVSAYNELEGEASSFSERIARNTQLLLRDEMKLGSVADPAGGSWYIESLTDELIEKAWSLFLEIDERDGIVEVTNQGWIQSKINEVKVKRQKDISTGKQTIVGTNKYANVKEEPLKIRFYHQPHDPIANMKKLVEERLTEAYERLRKRVEVKKDDEEQT
jgi:methylmalonyl-CoA mutase